MSKHVVTTPGGGWLNRVTRLLAQFGRGVLTRDELMAELLADAAVASRGSGLGEDDVFAVSSLITSSSNDPFSSVISHRLMSSVAPSTPSSAWVEHRRHLEQNLVQRWRTALAHSSAPPDGIAYLPSVPPATLGLVEVVDELRSVLDHRDPTLARCLAHVAPSSARAACLLADAGVASRDLALLREALNLLDPADDAAGEVLDASVSLVPSVINRDGARIDEAAWVAYFAGRATMVDRHDLTRTLSDIASGDQFVMPWPMLGCSYGVLAFAESRAGLPERAATRFAAETCAQGWADAGDRALLEWVHASSVRDPERRLRMYATATGFNIRNLDPAPSGPDTVSRWESDGHLRHGRLPWLEGRVRLDAVWAVRDAGLPADQVDRVLRHAAEWHARQTAMTPEGHLWHPLELHRITKIIAVSSSEIARVEAALRLDRGGEGSGSPPDGPAI